MALRRAAFVYFAAWVVGAQGAFALSALGARLPERSVTLFILFAAWPGAVVAADALVTARRATDAPEIDADAGIRATRLRWTALGLAAYAYWAASYAFVAWAVDPARARLLSGALEARIPFSPAWSLIYIGVHPFSLLPCLGLLDARLLRRHVAGHAAIVAISSAAWAAFPVASLHPELDPDARDFAEWALASLFGRDPVVNCLPSTHCAMAVFTASALGHVDARLGRWAWLTAAAIGASTLFTKEHYVVDVITGALLGGAAAAIAHRSDRRKPTNTNSTTPRRLEGGSAGDGPR